MGHDDRGHLVPYVVAVAELHKFFLPSPGISGHPLWYWVLHDVRSLQTSSFTFNAILAD